MDGVSPGLGFSEVEQQSACLHGEAFAHELSGWLPALRAFSGNFCRDAASAEDLVQDTALRAWIGRSSFLAGGNMKSWLFTIMRNAFYAMHAARRLDTQSMDEEGFPLELLPHDIPRQDAPLTRDDANRLLDAIPVDQRAALVLVAIAGLSIEEAAEKLGVEQGTVKSRLFRGRVRLHALVVSNTPLRKRKAAPDYVGLGIALLDIRLEIPATRITPRLVVTSRPPARGYLPATAATPARAPRLHTKHTMLEAQAA